MKKVIFISALAIAAAVSCTKSDIVDTKFGNDVIGFESYVGRDAQTKASVETATTLQATGFGVYGFYTDGYPARIVFQWSNFCNVYIMPWEWVCVSSILLDKNGNLFGEDFDESCGIHGSLYGYEFDYYVTKNTYQRKFAKHFGNMCTMEMYGVNVTFDKEVNGCKKLNFLVPYKSLITDQIHLNILSTLPPY
jgi:hypothetical protein